ncbi:hypothetical protein L218DRAFT_988009 [Marasmius fiardii PR-910]|nr:hypothetical protein L218DRAFT_988009 [Marasmius fiardii PR-910]
MAKDGEYHGLDITYAVTNCHQKQRRLVKVPLSITDLHLSRNLLYRKLQVYNSGDFQAEFGVKNLKTSKSTAKVAKKTLFVSFPILLRDSRVEGAEVPEPPPVVGFILSVEHLNLVFGKGTKRLCSQFGQLRQMLSTSMISFSWMFFEVG